METQWLSTGSSCVQKGYRVSRFRERSQKAKTLQNAKIPAKKTEKKTHVLLINSRLEIEYEDIRFAAPLIHSGR